MGSVAGLETTIFNMLLTVSVYLFHREDEGEGTVRYSAFSILLLVLCRPDGILFLTLAGACFLATRKLRLEKRDILWLLIVVLRLGAYAA